MTSPLIFMPQASGREQGDAPVKFRGHHLLCMQTYVGMGYTPEFVKNFNQLAERLNNGAAVQIVKGSDDVCSPLCSNMPGYHCHDPEVGIRDALAVTAVEEVLGGSFRPGVTRAITPDHMVSLRTAFKDGSSRAACKKCSWNSVCTDIANSGFQGVKIMPAAVPL